MNAKLSYNFQNFNPYIFTLTIALRFAHLKSQTKLNIVIVIAPNCPNFNKVLRQLTKLTNPLMSVGLNLAERKRRTANLRSISFNTLIWRSRTSLQILSDWFQKVIIFPHVFFSSTSKQHLFYSSKENSNCYFCWNNKAILILNKM